MSVTPSREWIDTNQRRLTAEVARVRLRLEGYAARRDGAARSTDDSTEAAPDAFRATESATLDCLCENFGLSPFERDLLLLCVGMEVDARFAALCAAVQGDPRCAHPTFGLALSALAGPHWSAITPAGPLRHWRLIELGPGELLTSSPLRVDERTLHFLTGVSYLDERLQSLIELVPQPEALPASYRVHAEQILQRWSGPPDERPVIHLDGDARGGKRMLAAAVSKALGLRLHALRASDIPSAMVERDTLVRLWERESVFSRSALLLDVDSPSAAFAAQAVAEQAQGWLFITGGAAMALQRRPVARFEVNLPGADEQRALWENSLGPLAAGLNGELDALVAQFPLDVAAIERAGRAVVSSESTGGGESLGARLWHTCRGRARQSLERLAQHIESVACWDDLVLPDEPRQMLREIASHVRQRRQVYDVWGFAARGDRGLGISALFAGPSGVGKTMAAEVLANVLALDLYRIDLSQVVSKYIGETEKNLSAVFDAAEEAGAILLFDEADALFGKRSEVKDSHDRYANIEVSYLLQRMEAYRGLAILTTNQRGALDPAFSRRIRFVVTFPFPDVTLRARIWERIFPQNTPTSAIDFTKLAKLGVTGGNIRNIALGAAFLAADAGEPVQMRHLLHSARSECAKIEKTLTSAEIGGWV